MQRKERVPSLQEHTRYEQSVEQEVESEGNTTVIGIGDNYDRDVVEMYP